MTKEEAVKAAEMRVPVVFHDPMLGDLLYNRISAVIWRYAGETERKRGKPEKYVELELEDRRAGGKSVMMAEPEYVDVQNQSLWPVQREIPTLPELEPEKPKPRARRKPFEPPSVENVAEYAVENQLTNVDALAFVDYYKACGWVVGKGRPMKDWQAAVRQWDRRQKEFVSEKSVGGVQAVEKQSSFETDAFFAAALAKSYGEG